MTQSINIRRFARYALVAALINSVIFLVAKSADATMIVNQGGAREIALPMVLGSTIFGLVFAAYIASLIGKKSTGFIAKAPVIGLVFGVVTAIAPFTASDDSKTSIALASMHIVAGVIWLLGAKSSTK
jgi:hypothetical protein